MHAFIWDLIFLFQLLMIFCPKCAQISELSLSGFIFGYPFKRLRSSPDVCFHFKYHYYCSSFTFQVNISVFCRLFKWKFLLKIFVTRGNLKVWGILFGMSASRRRLVLLAIWEYNEKSNNIMDFLRTCSCRTKGWGFLTGL